MQKTIRRLFSAPAIRLNTLVVLEVVILLLVSLGGLFYFTRKALVDEAKKDAVQRLEGTVQHADNILMSVEQSAGNFYFEIAEHLDRPDRIPTYCRRLVESNPNIVGCAIAFEPGYYPGRDLFLTYVHRKKYNSPELVMSDESDNIPYTKQNWYTETMKSGRAAWRDPGQNHEYKVEPIITFSMPIRDHGSECVGVISVGLSVNRFSQIVLENRPTARSYSMLLGNDGSFIIHPDREKLAGQTVFTVPDIANSPTTLAAARGMLKGESGEVSFLLRDEMWYAFYKPFVRADFPGRTTDALNWSIATIYPKADIFGEYNHLVFYVLGIAIVGLLIFYLLCRSAIRKQLKPLVSLTESADRIAEGHYDETVSDTKRDDEVGIFQQQFQHMQQVLVAEISKHQEKEATLNERREELQRIYRQIKEDDQVETTFLHNVTDRMIAPSESILNSVMTLCDNYKDITQKEAAHETENIKHQSETILQLLSRKFNISYNQTGKEDNHE